MRRRSGGGRGNEHNRVESALLRDVAIIGFKQGLVIISTYKMAEQSGERRGGAEETRTRVDADTTCARSQLSSQAPIIVDDERRTKEK